MSGTKIIDSETKIDKLQNDSAIEHYRFNECNVQIINYKEENTFLQNENA